MAAIPREEAFQDLIADMLILQGVAAHLLVRAIPDEARRRDALKEAVALVQSDIESRYDLLAMQNPDESLAKRWKERVARRLKHFGEIGKLFPIG
jgi:hypothetical protein